MTYQRLKATLQSLARTAWGGSAEGANGTAPPGAGLVEVGFGRRQPRFALASGGNVKRAEGAEEEGEGEDAGMEGEGAAADSLPGVAGWGAGFAGIWACLAEEQSDEDLGAVRCFEVKFAKEPSSIETLTTRSVLSARSARVVR